MTGSPGDRDLDQFAGQLRATAGADVPARRVHAAEREHYAGLLAAALGRPVDILMIVGRPDGVGITLRADDLAALLDRVLADQRPRGE